MHLIHEVKVSLLFPFYNKRNRYNETKFHHPLEKNHGIKEPIGLKLIFKILAAPEYSDFQLTMDSGRQFYIKFLKSFAVKTTKNIVVAYNSKL